MADCAIPCNLKYLQQSNLRSILIYFINKAITLKKTINKYTFNYLVTTLSSSLNAAVKLDP